METIPILRNMTLGFPPPPESLIWAGMSVFELVCPVLETRGGKMWRLLVYTLRVSSGLSS